MRTPVHAMRWAGFEIVCPRCRGPMEGDSTVLSCAACVTQSLVDLGIPDLRISPDPYISIDNDHAKGRHLASRFSEFDFAGLVHYYYSITPAVKPGQARIFTAGVLAGRARAQVMMDLWHKQVGVPKKASLLEIGCGTAPLLLAARERYDRLIGVDISFRWLTVGKKRMQDEGAEVPVMCACAEALPFPSASFDHVAMESTLEVTRDQPAVLRECLRVLRPGGALLITTQNRFSPGPDPHTGIWGGSMLPTRLVHAYVRRRGGLPPQRRFFSAGSLGRALAAAGFGEIHISASEITEGQREVVPAPLRIGLSAYRVARTLPGAAWLVRLVGPSLMATAHKPV